jgi:aminoglycoside phosphotransferase
VFDVLTTLWGIGVLEPGDILDTGLVVRDVSGRNHVHLVDGPLAAVVKLPGAKRPSPALERERDMLAWLGERQPELGPRLLAWEPVETILVTERLEGDTLASRVRRIGCLPATLAARIGDALGVLHAGSESPPFQAEPPGVLRVHRPVRGALGEWTPAQVELVKMVQRASAACAALEAAAADWRATAAIHADVRWENVMVADVGDPEHPDVRFVDWELSGSGDPCWDISAGMACAVRDELAPTARAARSSWDLVTGTDRALLRAQPAISAMWTAWRTRTEHRQQPASDVHERAMRLTGARLVQFADEIAVHATRLGRLEVLAARVGLELLERSQEAADLLLGPRDSAPAWAS